MQSGLSSAHLNSYYTKHCSPCINTITSCILIGLRHVSCSVQRAVCNSQISYLFTKNLFSYRTKKRVAERVQCVPLTFRAIRYATHTRNILFKADNSVFMTEWIMLAAAREFHPLAQSSSNSPRHITHYYTHNLLIASGRLSITAVTHWAGGRGAAIVCLCHR